MFVNKGNADKLSVRPADVPKSQVTKLGVLGAGMMGAGVAYVSAMQGMEVDPDRLDGRAGGEGQGLLREAAGEGRREGASHAGAGRGRARTHQADSRLRAARGRRSRDRSGVRASRHQGRRHGEGRGRHPEDLGVCQQHVDAADHGPRQGVEAAEELHRHSLLLAGREDAAGGDHRRQADGRRGDRARARLRRPAEEDADRGQRQPRLLHQPLLRHVHRRRREDAGRRHRPAADRKRGQACRHAGRPAGCQRRSEPRACVQGRCSSRARTSARSTRSRSAGRSCSTSSRT